ncbi:MAG TPA: diacylglycerol kinase [Beijerinckiaceae bacterium]|jgi:diacylglycerol kinase (ATP)
MKRSRDGWTHAIAAAFDTAAGLSHALRSETAVRQEMILLALAVPLAWFLASGPWQAVALIASVLLVLAIELLNTCVEKLCDHVTPDLHPTIKAVKDMGSAAVFFALCIAGLVWGCAFLERVGAF